MKRSSRNTAVGPGSRGGHWHDPEWRREWYRRYFREYRATHPHYREEERRRRLLAHALTRLTRVLAGGTYARP